MKTKRSIAVVLLSAFLLIGCSNSPAETPNATVSQPDSTPDVNTPDASEPDSPAADADALVSLPITEEVTTVTLTSALDAQLGQILDENEYASLIYYSELEKRTNIHLEMTLIGIQSFSEVLTVMLSGGEYTDVILSPSESYFGSYESAVEEEVVVDLSAFIAENMPNYMSILDEHPAYRKAVTSSDGRYLGLYGFYADDYPPSQGPVIRTDYLESVGMEMPETYDEYYELFKAFKSELNLEAPLFLSSACDMNGGAWAGGYGVLGIVGTTTSPPFYQIDGTVYFSPLEGGFLDYIKMLNKWYEEGLLYSDFATNTDAMIPTSVPDSWGVANMVGDFLDNYGIMFAGNENATFAGANIPVLNEGDTAHFRENVSQIQSTVTLITTVCEDPEMVCRYFDYYYSEEGTILLNYGVEGISFEYVEGKPVLMQEIYEAHPDLDEMTVAKLYGMSTGSFIRDWTRDASRYSDVRMEAVATWSKSDNAYNIPASVSMTADENSVYSNIYITIDTYIAENVPKFIMGEISFDEYDEFVEQLMELGIQDCIDMKQAALDRYLAD